MPFPDFTPGQESIPADGMQRLSDVARRFTGSLGGQGNNLLDITGATVQNSPPEDNWWIKITSGPGTGGGDAKAAPYGWQMINRSGTTFSDLSYAHSGTTTSNPAYEQNGNRNVPIGSIHRAWVNNDSGTPCMEFDAGGTDSCHVFIKMLVDICGTAFPLKKIFAIVRLCDGAIMSTVCEEVVDCGSPCPPSCDCSAIPCMEFTVSGVQSNCSSPSQGVVDCSGFNRTWCLPRATLGNGYELILSTGELAVITILADCTAFLEISKIVPFDCGCGSPDYCVTYARYSCSSFSCSTGCVFSLIQESVTGCKTFPATITVTPSYCCVESGGGGTGHDCTECAATTWKVTIAGTTDGTCTVCSAVNVTDLVLNNISTCQWQAFVGNITCGGFGTAISATLIDNGSTGWELTLSGLADYFLPYASWSCTGVNTMNKISGGAQCNWPATITVQKNS